MVSANRSHAEPGSQLTVRHVTFEVLGDDQAHASCISEQLDDLAVPRLISANGIDAIWASKPGRNS